MSVEGADPSAIQAAAADDREARIALALIAEPGDPRVLGAVAELGAVVVRDHLLGEEHLGGIRADLAARLAAADTERALDQAAQQDIRFITPTDDEWPTQLDDLDYAGAVQDRGGIPLGLWVRGPLRLDELETSVAVVGSRASTTYGAETAADIAGVVAHAGHPVVSGAAYGIDFAAHRGALAARGKTVAVLACGADRIYPAGHRQLLDFLKAEGAIVSEAPPGWAPTRVRFLARNRLIAALAVGTVVVEAAVRSGALNTANWAGRLNRQLLGVPGPVTSAPSAGVHQLIRDGAAGLVTSGADVLEAVGAIGQHLVDPPRGPERPRDRLNTRQKQVLDAVPVAASAGSDSIARTAGMALAEVRSTLTALADHGLVEHSPSGWRLAARATT